MSSLSGTHSGPTGGLSNKHAHITHLSTLRRRPPNTFDLNSRGDDDFGKGGITTKAYWGGSEGVYHGDTDSQKAVLLDKPEIKKTVSITITDSSTSQY